AAHPAGRRGAGRIALSGSPVRRRIRQPVRDRPARPGAAGPALPARRHQQPFPHRGAAAGRRLGRLQRHRRRRTGGPAVGGRLASGGAGPADLGNAAGASGRLAAAANPLAEGLYADLRSAFAAALAAGRPRGVRPAGHRRGRHRLGGDPRPVAGLDDGGRAGVGGGGAGAGNAFAVRRRAAARRRLGLAVVRRRRAAGRRALSPERHAGGAGLLGAAEPGRGPRRLAAGARAVRLGQDPAPARPAGRGRSGPRRALRDGAGPPISGSCRRAATPRLKPSSPAPGRTTPCWTAATGASWSATGPTPSCGPSRSASGRRATRPPSTPPTPCSTRPTRTRAGAGASPASRSTAFRWRGGTCASPAGSRRSGTWPSSPSRRPTGTGWTGGCGG